MAPELQEDGMVQLLVMSIKYIFQFLNPVPQEILVTAPELPEDGMVQLLVMSIKYISQFLNPVLQEILVTAPELQGLQGLKVIVVALNSGTGLSWSCDWDSQVLKVSSLVTNSLVTV